MSDKARREEEGDLAGGRVPEVQELREAEDERGGFRELHEAVKRIREAVAEKKPPRAEDIKLAQRYLGNARVAKLLQGLDPEAEIEENVEEDGESPGKFRLAIYVRKQGTQGPFDPGQCILGLQGEQREQLYGFHPASLGPQALRQGGMEGEIQVDERQLALTRKTAEIEVTREQLEAIRLQAESLRGKPPAYDFWKWNSMHFAAELMLRAGVEIPNDSFSGLATAESMRDTVGKAQEPKKEDEADGDGDKGEGDGDEDMHRQRAAAEAAAAKKAKEAGEAGKKEGDKDKDKDKGKPEKKGFFKSLLGGGGKGGSEGGDVGK